MNVSVQTDNMRLLRVALESHCSAIRFGSDSCEHLLPSLDVLRRARELAHGANKRFTYVTPRLSNRGIEKLVEQLPALADEGNVDVVVNDLGALRVLEHRSTLRPHLGRHLLMVPSRSPWADSVIQSEPASSEKGSWIRRLYASTSLNYQATMRLYGSHGCGEVDVDWIPRVFPSYGSLVESGLAVSVYLYLVPVTFTRKCHMARYLGEEDPEQCSMPCLRTAFLLRNEVLEAVGTDFLLHGNTVYRVIEPTTEGVAELDRLGVTELILPMNPLTGVDSAEKIDDLISGLVS